MDMDVMPTTSRRWARSLLGISANAGRVPADSPRALSSAFPHAAGVNCPVYGIRIVSRQLDIGIKRKFCHLLHLAIG